MAEEYTNYKRLNRTPVHHGAIIDYYTDEVQLPDGRTEMWDFIDHKGAAAAVAVLDDGRLVMVRQFRNALDRLTLELPAGGLQYRGEPTLDAARRELKEETGYAATSMELLLNLRTTVAFCNEKIDIYLAKGLVRGQQHLDDDEYLGVEIHDLEELKGMIFRGEIEDAKTIAGILTYADRLREEESRRG